MRTVSKDRKLRNGRRKTSKGRRKTNNGGSIGFSEMTDALNEIARGDLKKRKRAVNKKQQQALKARNQINTATNSGIRKTRHTHKNLIAAQNNLNEIQKVLNTEQKKLDVMQKQYRMNNMIQNEAIARGKSGTVNLLDLMNALPSNKSPGKI